MEFRYCFPFVSAGRRAVYITATRAEVGVEIRPIPQDDIDALLRDIRAYAEGAGLEMLVEVQQGGIVCSPDNPHLLNVLASVRKATGQEPVIGRKLPGTSARFAPGGQGIVWGQSGLGPHAPDERHFIPSIQPYYDALTALAEQYRISETVSEEANG
jgi:acetylornithine deacetylase/succinyl-diaminopimelate desuccinylase-like protein